MKSKSYKSYKHYFIIGPQTVYLNGSMVVSISPKAKNTSLNSVWSIASDL